MLFWPSVPASDFWCLAFSAYGKEGKASFTELRSRLDFTAGNLSIQLKNLEEAGFVTMEPQANSTGGRFHSLVGVFNNLS